MARSRITYHARISPTKRQLLRQRKARQNQWLLFWVLAGTLVLCLLIYPVAFFVAHYYDEAEKEPLVTSHTVSDKRH